MQCPQCEIEMYPYEYKNKGVYSYGGPSEWRCPQCPLRIGYFCSQPLTEDEIESVECKGCQYHPKVVEL